MKSPTPVANLTEVLSQLDAIVVDTHAESSRLGYFATLYRRVTRRVAQGITAGTFDDGARMDRLDTNFANRYFAALSAHLRGQPTPKAWAVAFRAVADGKTIALQHLLLGMNAHINVDLGAAVAEVAPGNDVKRDFDRIGELLSEMIDKVQADLGAVSPRLAEVDQLAGAADEHLAVFSIRAARDDAWVLAKSLALTPPPLRPFVESLADQKAAFLGRVLAHPPPPARALIAIVRAAESPNVKKVIDILAS
ncbi:MAG: DUF5995 family protein [Planctomycetota bacterium]